MTPDPQDLVPLLAASLASLCTCKHFAAVHKGGDDGQHCLSCPCALFTPRPRLRLVEDAA